LVEFADRLGIAAYVTAWQIADTFNRAVFFPLVDLLLLPDEILKCVFKLTDDDLTALAAFPGGHDDVLIGVIVGGGKAPKIVRRLVGYGNEAPKKLPRYQGPKPKYHVNPQHVPGHALKPGKTPLPKDAESVFKNAVPNDPKNPTAWFGKNADGQIYRFSAGNDGTAHFSGIHGVGDGTRNLTDYAKQRLGGL
jgi:hypothetical protein